jgi:hypothetical protein
MSAPFSTVSSNAPDYRGGYLRVPLSLWLSAYCRTGLTRRELQLVSVVLRESWGWRSEDGKVRLWTRSMTPARFARATGLSTDRIGRDLDGLVERGVLLEREGRYQLVTYPQAWEARPSKRRSSPPKAREGAAEKAPGTECYRKTKDNLKKRSKSDVGDNFPLEERSALLPDRPATGVKTGARDGGKKQGADRWTSS